MKRIGQQSPINPNDHKHRDTSYNLVRYRERHHITQDARQNE
jgi:hypothetical protein